MTIKSIIVDLICPKGRYCSTPLSMACREELQKKLPRNQGYHTNGPLKILTEAYVLKYFYSVFFRAYPNCFAFGCISVLPKHTGYSRLVELFIAQPSLPIKAVSNLTRFLKGSGILSLWKSSYSSNNWIWSSTNSMLLTVSTSRLLNSRLARC